MKHNTQKKIANSIKMYGMPFNISFKLSNALFNERLSTNTLKKDQASNITTIAPTSCIKIVTELIISSVISNLRIS